LLTGLNKKAQSKVNISAMEVVFFKTQKFRSEDPIRLFFLSLVDVGFGKLSTP